jgi:hypothetical protein
LQIAVIDAVFKKVPDKLQDSLLPWVQAAIGGGNFLSYINNERRR